LKMGWRARNRCTCFSFPLCAGAAMREGEKG
jgi:hypothetical protein